MNASGSELARYELGETLGEGADLQVFAGRDLETGADVVLKRPHPTLVSRNQHWDIEASTHNLARIRLELGGEIAHVPSLLGVSGPKNHGSLFRDSLGNEYTVTVESRARGVPLVGSAVDGLQNYPIGLPMNLFCRNPLQPHAIRGETPLLLDILETVEVFYEMGYLLMDMRPQNVFYAPKTGEVSIIDIGDFCAPREATQRHPPLDIHDMLLDLVRWHLPANDPPLEIDSWTRYAEPLRSPQFEGAVDDTRRLFSNEDLTDDRALAMRILDRIKARGYSGVSEFKTDAQEFFELRRQRITSSPALPAQMELWKQGVAMMRDDYWSKFLFSGGLDLSTYTGSD